jgi:hypothetical protein
MIWGRRGMGATSPAAFAARTNDDFMFTENIGAGLMKRVGCGSNAVLNVTVDLSLTGKVPGGDAALDSSDSAAKHGLIYYFNLEVCRK